MRLFISLPVSDKAKDAFMRLQQTMMGGKKAPVKWTEKNHCHVTLIFLGEVALDKVAELSDLIERVVSQFKPLMLRFNNLGAFPNWDKPNAFVLHLAGENNAVVFQSRLNQALKEYIISKNNRQWKPHLTFGRVKSEMSAPLAWRDLRIPPISWIADRVELIESRLLPGGPEYRLIKEFPFIID